MEYSLSLQQMERVAALKYHEGFQIIIDRVKARLDESTRLLETCGPDEILSTLAYWRGLRVILDDILSFVNDLSDRIEMEKALTGSENYELDPSAMTANQVRAMMAKLDKKLTKVRNTEGN